MIRHSRRYRAKLVVLGLAIAAAVLAACGGGGGSDSSPERAPDTGDAPATEATGDLGSGACAEDASLAMTAYELSLLPGVPGSGDFTTMTYDNLIQLVSRNDAVGEFFHQLGSEGLNPLWESFSTTHFATTFDPSVRPTFTANEVQYLDDESAVILFTVDVDTNASQVPQVLAHAQFAGRLACSQGTWQVALADACSILAEGTGPACPGSVEQKANAALTPALEKAELPEVSAPTVETVPTTTAPPISVPPGPAPPFDGVCPYVGQPCSANVTNDPDCTCVPSGGSPGFSKWLGVIACGN